MNRCGGCGKFLEGPSVSCPWCGGTVIPARAERGLQPLFREGQEVAGRFRVEKVLGTGASGVVYGAWDALRQGRVALKVLWAGTEDNAAGLERLRREIRASQRAPHPHLVAIHDILVAEEHPALVMEWVEGETLRDRIRREGALPWREAASVAEALLAALVHLHSLGIVHRDVKSGNVLLGSGGAVKLGDFGLVKGEDLGMSLTETGLPLGTPGYMAPEVIRGQEATALSDLYSVGATLFEMLAGRLPFAGASSLEVASRQLSGAPPLSLLREKSVPRWLRRLVARLLETEPHDRFPAARSALDALRKRTSGFSLPRRLRVRAALLLAAALLAAGAFFLWRWSALQAPLEVAFHGRTLEARTSSGKLAWRKEFPRLIQSAVYGGFGPGGRPAVACACAWDWAPGKGGGYPNELVVMNRDGSELGTYDLQTFFNPFEQRYTVDLSTHRFSRGDHERLVIRMVHALWYPCLFEVVNFDSALGGSAPGAMGIDCQFYNSGHVSSVAYRDLDGDGQDEVVFTAVNNRLYWSDAVGAIRLEHSKRLWPDSAASPDELFQGQGRFLFYRLLGFEDYTDLRLSGRDRSAPLLLNILNGPVLQVEPTGVLLQAGRPLAPPPEAVERLNAGLSDLCTLRDLERWQDLLEKGRAWSASASGPYAWVGRLFQAQALMGLGRYAEARASLEAAREDLSGMGAPPAYYFQYLLDGTFLEGRYDRALEIVNGLPGWARDQRPELAETAMWAGLYAGDPKALDHYMSGTALNRMGWERDLFDGISHFFVGAYAEGERRFRGLVSGAGANLSAPYQWLVACLIREGKVREARSVLDQTAAAFPTEHLEGSETELWLRWNEGRRSRALVSQFRELVARRRMEARTVVEARALLPLTLARASAVYRAAGAGSEASKAEAEALRLAPGGWRPVIREIASSR